jgi:hypothetical protein
LAEGTGVAFLNHAPMKSLFLKCSLLRLALVHVDVQL